MKRYLAILLLALLPGSVPALDLTPQSSFRELEGFKIPVLILSDNGKKISLQPPSKWTISSTGSTLTLKPAETPDAVLELRVRPFKPLAAGLTEDVEKWSRAQLPQDAVQATLEGEAANVFTLGALPSRQFTYSYGAQGRRFTTAVAIVDWSPTERLAVLVTARTSDFVATHEAAMRCVFSWTAL